MINIFRSILYSLIGLSVIGWVSVLLIFLLLVGPDADGRLTLFFADHIIISEKLTNLGVNFAEVARGLFQLVSHMLITLLSVTIFFSVGWSAGSHYLNIDAPGKAKIYFIHWIVCTGVFVFILFGITFYFTQTTAYYAADLIGAKGYIIILLSSLIYFFLMYYLGVLIGTARFARSSVLLANKLPGNL